MKTMYSFVLVLAALLFAVPVRADSASATYVSVTVPTSTPFEANLPDETIAVSFDWDGRRLTFSTSLPTSKDR